MIISATGHTEAVRHKRMEMDPFSAVRNIQTVLWDTSLQESGERRLTFDEMDLLGVTRDGESEQQAGGLQFLVTLV